MKDSSNRFTQFLTEWVHTSVPYVKVKVVSRLFYQWDARVARSNGAFHLDTCLPKPCAYLVCQAKFISA